MSIKHAILGILKQKPSTGYEIKKIIQESSVLYWSGSNNQIYRTLIKMKKEELVADELVHQEDSPSKKIYSITEKGLSELKEWVKSSPELPEFKKGFLIQLLWSSLLNKEELNNLLSEYENKIQEQLLMEQEKIRRALPRANVDTGEHLIWEVVADNITSSYQNELNWVRKTRNKLLGKETKEV